MKMILNSCGMFLGGWIGWAAGIHLGIFTAFVLSIVGSGAGLYAAARITRHYAG
jgi:hypothetical protein